MACPWWVESIVLILWPIGNLPLPYLLWTDMRFLFLFSRWQTKNLPLPKGVLSFYTDVLVNGFGWGTQPYAFPFPFLSFSLSIFSAIILVRESQFSLIFLFYTKTLTNLSDVLKLWNNFLWSKIVFEPYSRRKEKIIGFSHSHAKSMF